MVEKQEKKEESPKKEKKKSEEEFEKLVLELAEKGLTAEKIGETLKKQGVHSKDYPKKISKILGNKYVNPDQKNLQEKLEKLEKHAGKNKNDKRAMRDKEKISARLRRAKIHFNKD